MRGRWLLELELGKETFHALWIELELTDHLLDVERLDRRVVSFPMLPQR